MDLIEWLRHPLWSILTVPAIGIVAGLLFAVSARVRRRLGGRTAFVALTAAAVGMAGAFIGFHAAMLSNMARDMAAFPFTVAAAASVLLLLGWAALMAER